MGDMSPSPFPGLGLDWCRRAMYLTGGKGGYCQRRRRHPGVCTIDPAAAREMDAAGETSDDHG